MGVPAMRDGVPLMSGGVPTCSCCDPFCDGCSETSDIGDLTLTVDASAAVLEPAWGHGCGDDTCQDLSGTYTLVSQGPPTTIDLQICQDTSGEPAPCAWVFCPVGTAGDLAPDCGSNTPWAFWVLTIGQYMGDWWIGVTLNLRTYSGIGSPGGTNCALNDTECGIFTWGRNLGAARPECTTLFPLTLTSADFLCDSIDLQNCCIFDDIELTIDLP